MRLRTLPGLAPLACALAAGCALAAEPGCPPLPGFDVQAGTITRGAACDTYVLTTGAESGRSKALVLWPGPAEGPYRITFELQRLDAALQASVAIGFRGAYLLLRQGAWGLYETEPSFGVTGWHTDPAIDLVRPLSVDIERGVRTVVIRLGGREVYRGEPRRPQASLVFDVTGPAGQRSRTRIAHLQLSPLEIPGR